LFVKSAFVTLINLMATTFRVPIQLLDSTLGKAQRAP